MNVNAIQQQLDVSKSLLSALDSLLESFEGSNAESVNQTQMVAEAVEEMSEQAEKFDQTASKSQSMSRDLNSAANSEAVKNNIVATSEKVSADITKSMKSASDKVETSNKKLSKASSKVDKSKDDVLKTGKLLDAAEDVQDSLSKTNKDILTFRENVKDQTSTLSMWDKIVSMLAKVKDGFMTGGLSLLRDIPGLLLSFAKTAFNIFSSLIGSLTKFFAFTVTLPFTFAKIAANIGNQIRTDLVETIQSAGEEAKESFDLTSNIGKNADKMTQTAKGLLKTFQNPESRLVKLFNMGASGAATFLKETFKAVDDMGHYAEIFGPSILGSTKNGQFVIEMQRAMGIGSKEMAYYALEAYNAGEHPIDTLTRTSEAIKAVADRNDQDFKALTKDFHALRTNITEFGHLSSNEIANLTGKLRSMKIKTEDAVNVFKKFTSFEEAAKTSAMLFQTFEMNIDAFDLLTARDPGEMLQQFRDAMFQTGKAFKDLNRHEKSLMASITGISEQGLSSLMNYMDLGLTQDEARKKLEEQDPTKEQEKMIKGLSSTIKLFQKTLTFQNPFQAFFRGLADNSMNQKDLQNSLISLSKVYQEIYKMGASLNLSSVSSALNPIIKILKSVDETVNGVRFKQVMSLTVGTASRFFTNIYHDLETDPEKLKKIEKKSVVDRVNELYSDLKAMTGTGSSLFGNMATLGGKIMGGIIKGAVYGITAAFHLLAGGTDQALSSLGITMTDQMKKDAADRKIPEDKYTILHWLGISQTDADGISSSLGDAIGDFVTKLPSLMSMASSVLEDLSEVLLQFAASLLGILGSMTLEYYESSNAITQAGLRFAGFDVEAARYAKDGVRPGESLDTDMSDLISKTNVKGTLKEGYIGTYVSYIEDLQRSFPRGSPAYNFLNSPKTSQNINYIKNTGNFKFDTLGNIVDDAEEPQRAQAILDIAKNAYKVNSYLPHEVFSLFKNVENKPEWYDNDINFANKKSKELADALIKGPDVDGHYSSDANLVFDFANNVTKTQTLAAYTLKRLVDEKKIVVNNGKYGVPKGVQDIEYAGKNTVLVTPNANYFLDDFDTILASKKGGFFNKLLIGLTDYFGQSKEASEIKIINLNKNLNEAEATVTHLLDNRIKREDIDYEAGEEDFMHLFDLYDDIISIITNKENLQASAKVAFEA